MLSPSSAAFANVEWTGELAGAESEKVSLLAIQLASKQDAFGMLTTVRIGPMQQMMP